MLIGVLLAISWLVLLIRYPGRALPISLGALLGLALVGSWLLWEEHRERSRLARLELRLEFQPAHCPADRPLQVYLHNGSDVPLRSLRWEIAAYTSGSDLNLARRGVRGSHYQAPEALKPGESWQSCLPLPELRPGYRPATLRFRAEALEGRFAD